MQRGAILGQAACGVGIARYFLVAFVAAAPLPSQDSWCVSQQLLAFIPAWLPTFQEQLWYTSPCKHHTLVSLSEYLGNACKILQVGQSYPEQLPPLACSWGKGAWFCSQGIPTAFQLCGHRNPKPNLLLTLSTILNC